MSGRCQAGLVVETATLFGAHRLKRNEGLSIEATDEESASPATLSVLVAEFVANAPNGKHHLGILRVILDFGPQAIDV